jgi:two-component system chemotaxis response regulator CheY
MFKTLVVDDSPTIRRMVIASLRDVCGGGFVEAGTGLEALEQLALAPVGLIILDLNMPDMHGLEVLNFVRSHQRYRSIPVVVLTTRTDHASRAAVLDGGASLYLTKPFAPQALAHEVRTLLEQRTAARTEASRSGDV